MEDEEVRYGSEDDGAVTGLPGGDAGFKGGASPDPDADVEDEDDWTDATAMLYPEISDSDDDAAQRLRNASGNKGGAAGDGGAWRDENPVDELGIDEDDANAMRSRVPPSTEPGVPLL